MSRNTPLNLADLARSRNIDPGEVIDPVALAVRLIQDGESVQQAAALCGVNRTTLHRKIAASNNSASH